MGEFKVTSSETEDGQKSFNGRDAITGDEKSGLKEVIIDNLVQMLE